MKKLLAIVVVCFCACAVFAGPHHGGRGPAPRGHHGGHHGNDDVWLAAGITSIVANGIQILNGVAVPQRTVVVPAAPAVVPAPAPAPVYTEPVYYQPRPRYVAPAPAVYYPPAPVYTRPVYYHPAPAPRHVIIYDNGCGAPRHHNYGW